MQGSAPPLPPLVAAHVYRIACEAIVNALRHADASAIFVQLRDGDHVFVVSVRDDGRGMPIDKRPGATGLRAMENRAASIGANLILTTPADGTGHARGAAGPVPHRSRRLHMIRVVIVDDHPALRAGLRAVLDAEPGIVFAGESGGDEESLWPILNRSRPDLMLLDYHLPRGDGLQLCYRIKHEVPAPRVIIFSAYASPSLSLPAMLAQADGLLAKDLGARDLFHAIRAVYGGERLIPPVSATVLEDAFERLDADHHALIGMLLDGTSEADVAETLGLERREVRHAVHRILHALRLDIPQRKRSAADLRLPTDGLRSR